MVGWLYIVRDYVSDVRRGKRERGRRLVRIEVWAEGVDAAALSGVLNAAIVAAYGDDEAVDSIMLSTMSDGMSRRQRGRAASMLDA